MFIYVYVCVYVHIYGTCECPSFCCSNLRNKAFANQNKGHLGARCICIYIYVLCIRNNKVELALSRFGVVLLVICFPDAQCMAYKPIYLP